MSGVARVWFGLTAVLVIVALAVQIPITAATEGGLYDEPAARVANLFTFFTILTNLVVAVTSGWLALAPSTTTTLLRVLRLCAILGIAVTGVVYHTLLAGLRHLEGAEWVTDQVFHTVVPIVTVLGWILFGPRGLVDRRVVVLSMIYPLAWLVFALVRGAVISWYPYPFLDVGLHGYGVVALNCVGITLLFAVLAVAAQAVDRALMRQGPVPQR